jgi:hypothetical protein
MNHKITAIILVVAILFSGALYWTTTHEVMRWQAKGIKLYKQQVIDKTTEGKTQQPWLTDNPYLLALKVWVELGSNLVALLVCMFSGAKLLMRKKEYWSI